MAARQYRVRSEDRSVKDGQISGADLMQTGLQIKLPGKYTSDLIYLEEVKP